MANPSENVGKTLERLAAGFDALAGVDPTEQAEVVAGLAAGVDDLLRRLRAGRRAARRRPSRPGHGARGALDLSVLVAPELPCTWPVLPPLVVMNYARHGPGPFAAEALVIDEHTGTHWDAPNHFVPPPATGLPNATAFGAIPSHEVPVWQFVGEACVIDVEDLVVGPGNGRSNLITKARVQQWEQGHGRPLGPGDVVLFRSLYTNRYYRPFPAGLRFTVQPNDPFGPAAPGWPAPDPECVRYLAQDRRVNALGTDGANIGPVEEPVGSHLAGEQAGLIWTEVLTNLDRLPDTGAFYALLGSKHANGSAGEARAVAITEPGEAGRLIASARRQRVVDLTVLLREDLPVSWPGRSPAHNSNRPPHGVPYAAKTLHSYEDFGPPVFVRTHLMDSHTGTHLVPPAYAVPPAGFDRARYAGRTRRALRRFEREFGRLRPTDLTADRVPVRQLIGPARVIDVAHRVGASPVHPGAPAPVSPVIRVEDVRRHERRFGRIRPGDVVLFRSGHSDRHLQALPHGLACIALPLAGLAEGWPAPDARTILYLADRGVRCVGTDGPRMGSVDPDEAVRTYWAGGSRRVCFVEYLTNLGQLPPVGGHFLFAPVKIKGSHGGHGRALGLF